jgi:hypothetical protein
MPAGLWSHEFPGRDPPSPVLWETDAALLPK